MKIHRRVTAAIVCLGTMCCLPGCAPEKMPPEYSLDSAQFHVESGMKLLELGKYDHALRDFGRSKELNKTFSGAYVGSGLAWGYKGSWKKGFKHIEKAEVQANTNEEKAFANVGLIRLCLIGKQSAHKNWLNKAQSAYNEAVSLLPDFSDAHYFMGQAYRHASDFDKARELFQKVVQINGNYVAEARHALGVMK